MLMSVRPEEMTCERFEEINLGFPRDRSRARELILVKCLTHPNLVTRGSIFTST